MIVDDYIAHCAKYTEQYGPATVVLMQVGDFFELYATEAEGAAIHAVCDLCNLQVSRKNKSVVAVSRSNPQMAGFPLYSLGKYTQILLSASYTIVIVRQTTPPPDVRREVTEVLSPSLTPVVNGKDGNWLMVAFTDSAGMGFAMVDVTTGVTEVHEAEGRDGLAIDEAFRILAAYAPKELVLIGKEQPDLAQLQTCLVHSRCDRATEFVRPAFQNSILQKVYQPRGLLTPIEVVGLERHPMALTAFCYLIQFAYEHNESICSKLHRPVLLAKDAVLTLQYNAASQLNLDSFINGHKWCSTAFGARLMRARLLNPVCEPSLLNARYDAIDLLIKDQLYQKVRTHLGRMLDLERMARRIALGTFLPHDWCGLNTTLEAAEAALDCLDCLGCLGCSADIQVVTRLRAGYEDLDLEAAARYGQEITGNLWRPGHQPALDRLQAAANQGLADIEAISARLGQTARLECNERDGYSILITKKRYAAVDAALVRDLKLTAKPVSASSTVLRVLSPAISTASDSILANRARLSAASTELYKAFLNDFSNRFDPDLAAVIRVTGEMDVVAASAKVAQDCHYTRPTLESDDSTSRVRCIGMRHPIIERLQTATAYVPNDVTLDGHGLLLYGINSAGKSSLMKAIGLNVIMAQAGMFVACEQMHLVPYTSLFTRICSGDDLYRGQSAFTVEMSELRNILARADAHSLVLGDELCAGTEAVSGLAIVAAGIHALLAARASFTFATHLHDLTTIGMIGEYIHAGRLMVAHMHIDVQPDGKIVYDRTLREGSGQTLYGLEVCRALHLPPAFLDVANRVRREIQKADSVVSERRSRYSPDVYLDVCAVCGDKAEETHHIAYQRTADAAGFIGGGVHKDSPCNLAPLCERCHLAEHRGHIAIEGYVATTAGVELKCHRMTTIGSVEPVDTAVAIDVAALKGRLAFGLKGWRCRLSGRGRWTECRDEHAAKLFPGLTLEQRKVCMDDLVPALMETL